MRNFLLLVFAFVAATALPCAPAQGPASPATQEAKPATAPDGNYVLSLSPSADKKGGPEIALVVALPGFDKARDPAWTQTTFEAFDSNQPPLRFKGAFLPQKDGRYLLNYYVECLGDSATSGVLLHPASLCR